MFEAFGRTWRQKFIFQQLRLNRYLFRSNGRKFLHLFGMSSSLKMPLSCRNEFSAPARPSKLLQRYALKSMAVSTTVSPLPCLFAKILFWGLLPECRFMLASVITNRKRLPCSKIIVAVLLNCPAEPSLLCLVLQARLLLIPHCRLKK